MGTNTRTGEGRGRPARALIVLAVAVAVLMAACGGGPAADSPSGVVRTALDKVAAKDLDGLRTLACAGQEDALRDRLGLPTGLGSDIVPGLDATQVLGAVKLDVSKVTVGGETVTGDRATVQVGGDVTVTVDKELMRPILKQLLAAQGTTMTDAQIDALLSRLEQFGQSVPVDQSVSLVREGGAWKICEDVPASS